ncbi:MAG: four helix bundle protein [Planctomycetia bacterium]|nr:four helix bundle protein [Planctomycetia bacterium]
MSGVHNFTDLLFWQRARQWSKTIFWRSKEQPFAADERLVVQIWDSSESIGANVAEGFGRGTQGEFVQFLGCAIGSLNETQSHLCAAYDRTYLNRDEFAKLFGEGTEIRKMIVAFMRSMVQPGSGVKHLGPRPDWGERVWEIYERVTGQKRPKQFERGEA